MTITPIESIHESQILFARYADINMSQRNKYFGSMFLRRQGEARQSTLFQPPRRGKATPYQ
jgi:hypothetical protein